MLVKAWSNTIRWSSTTQSLQWETIHQVLTQPSSCLEVWGLKKIGWDSQRWTSLCEHGVSTATCFSLKTKSVRCSSTRREAKYTGRKQCIYIHLDFYIFVKLFLMRTTIMEGQLLKSLNLTFLIVYFVQSVVQNQTVFGFQWHITGKSSKSSNYRS